MINSVVECRSYTAKDGRAIRSLPLRLMAVLESENQKLEFNNFQEALKGISIAAFEDKGVGSSELINLVSYRQHSLELATFMKLYISLACDTAIDCVIIDSLDSEYRFTLIYLIQSTAGNVGYNIVTKTDDLFPAVSLQGIYPALN